jgi:hypothetical protein
MKTIEQNFADWESTAFGFGYGSGERPVFVALKEFFAAFEADGRSYQYEKLEAAVTAPTAWLLINRLCSYQIKVIEYGTSPRYGWLTQEGENLKRFIDSRSVDELVDIACNHVDVCYPDACNCGPEGYEEGRVCFNPFWRGHHT